MYKVTCLLHLADPTEQMATDVLIKRITSAAETAQAQQSLIARTLPGVRNGGDLIAHLQFPTRTAWLHNRALLDEAMDGPAIEHVDSVEYASRRTDTLGAGRSRSPRPPTVYRTLLLRVHHTAPPDDVRRFEHLTLQMPEHIRAIQSWQLSRVDRASGSSQWTHVWEQEFADVDELLGPYMHHPIHWAAVDRWFDPECPEHIVKDRVCHSFCESPGPVIDPTTEHLAPSQES